jgi:hypothetical protein
MVAMPHSIYSSFNLIEYVKRKYGFTPDVAWLKANVTKLTANWWGFGTNAQANPSGITNFVGKVSGSTVENANKYGQTQSATLTHLQSIVEGSSAAYTAMSTLDGSCAVHKHYHQWKHAQQHIFSFDLIAYVERKYSITIPGADIAAKVAMAEGEREYS